MRTMAVRADARAWLERGKLLDEGVDFDEVKLKVGGPIGLYLRLVKKSAMTIGDSIWFVSEEKRADDVLLAHELVHVAQYRKMGVPRFLFVYFKDMAKAGFKYSSRLPLEAPAYERQKLARSFPRGDEPLNA